MLEGVEETAVPHLSLLEGEHARQQIAILIQIQQLDEQLASLDAHQKRHEQLVAAAAVQHEAALLSLASARSSLNKINKEWKALEQALSLSEERVRKLKDCQTDLKTNKEYQARLAEIEAAKADGGKIEESILVLMEKAEPLKKAVAEQEAIARVEGEKLQGVKAEIETERVQRAGVRETFVVERDALFAKVAPTILKEYRRLMTRPNRPAIARLLGNVCAGCRFSLPPQFVVVAKAREKILRCTYCECFLYATVEPSPS